MYRTVEQTDDDDDAWRSIQQSSSLGKLRRSLHALPKNGKKIFADFGFVYQKAKCHADDDFPALTTRAERERAELMIHEWMLTENSVLLFAGAIAACRMQKYFDGTALIAGNCFALSSELRFWCLWGGDVMVCGNCMLCCGFFCSKAGIK